MMKRIFLWNVCVCMRYVYVCTYVCVYVCVGVCVCVCVYVCMYVCMWFVHIRANISTFGHKHTPYLSFPVFPHSHTTHSFLFTLGNLLLAILLTEAVCFYLLSNSVHTGQSSITPLHDVITKTAARGPFWSHS